MFVSASDQMTATIWFLSTISRRDDTDDLGEILKTYGPVDAPKSEYANVIINAEDCLQNATEKDAKGIPQRKGDPCNCLEMADRERQRARANNPNRR